MLRTELIWYDKKGRDQQEGFLTYVEVAGQPTENFKGNIRLQYFETGGYDSRIYVYESDVLYGYSIPAFYDKGFRLYINASCSILKNITAWMRIAQTISPEKLSIGSGLDAIQGNKRTEIKFQLRYHF